MTLFQLTKILFGSTIMFVLRMLKHFMAHITFCLSTVSWELIFLIK